MSRYKFDDSSVGLFTSQKNQGKRSRRESLIFRSVAEVASNIFADIPALRDVFVSRVTFSKKSGLCIIAFGVLGGDQEKNTRALSELQKLKGALRAIVARTLEGAWCPEIAIEIDGILDKVAQINKKIFETINSPESTKSVNDVILELKNSIESKMTKSSERGDS